MIIMKLNIFIIMVIKLVIKQSLFNKDLGNQSKFELLLKIIKLKTLIMIMTIKIIVIDSNIDSHNP